ncbi:MAG TPA: corrinoid protein [Candidatus Saccharimonadales bacterium]|nr:corrinoid protein [Candidatus Saccharimonadales bacterium]
MSENAQDLYKALSDAVVGMDEDRACELSIEAVERGFDAYTTIERGLVDGMGRAGDLFESEEYFIPELLLCSDAMYAGLDILRPHLKVEDANQQRFKVVIGVVEGDTHDIGKNLVKIMLEASGFDVIDLGRDIPAQKFVDTAVLEKADIIALSTLMTTTMDAMAEVVEKLHKNNLRESFKVIVGGGPISSAFAKRIQADGYANSAPNAVKLVKQLVGVPA